MARKIDVVDELNDINRRLFEIFNTSYWMDECDGTLELIKKLMNDIVILEERIENEKKLTVLDVREEGDCKVALLCHEFNKPLPSFKREFIIAYGYNEETRDWSQGSYTPSLKEAMDEFYGTIHCNKCAHHELITGLWGEMWRCERSSLECSPFSTCSWAEKEV